MFVSSLDLDDVFEKDGLLPDLSGDAQTHFFFDIYYESELSVLETAAAEDLAFFSQKKGVVLPSVRL